MTGYQLYPGMMDLSVRLAVLMPFWYGMLCGITASFSNGDGFKPFLLPASVCSALVHFFIVPFTFSFSYVQTVVYLISSYCGLTGKKDDVYDKVALIIVLPNLAMTWVESVTCDSFLANYGGHFWYDFMLPFCLFVYFLQMREKSKNKNKDKDL